jgi:FkbM family methyltransferase
MKKILKKILLRTSLLRPSLIFARNTFDRSKLREHRSRMAFFKQFVRPGDLCFDIGCNVGHMSEALLDIGARVVGVDPQDDCLNEARARVGTKRQIEFLQTAVGAQEGTAQLYVAKSSVVSSLKPDWFEQHTSRIEVPLTTLDGIIDRFGTPHYIKIDVEGFEIEVLKGLSKKINCISFEYHTSHKLESLENTMDCLNIVKNLQDGSVVNVNLNNEPFYYFPNWMEIDSFCNVLKNELWEKPRSFGDIVMLSSEFARALGDQSCPGES